MNSSTEWIKGIEEKLEAKRQKQMVLKRRRKAVLSTAAACAMMFCVLVAVPQELREFLSEESNSVSEQEKGAENQHGEASGMDNNMNDKAPENGQDDSAEGIFSGYENEENYKEIEEDAVEEKIEETIDETKGTPDEEKDGLYNRMGEEEVGDSSEQNRIQTEEIQNPMISDDETVGNQEMDNNSIEEKNQDSDEKKLETEYQNKMTELPSSGSSVKSEKEQSNVFEQDNTSLIEKNIAASETETEIKPSENEESFPVQKEETAFENNEITMVTEYDRILWMGREYIRTDKTVSIKKTQGVIGTVAKKVLKKKFRQFIRLNKISSKIRATNLEKGTKIYQIKGRKVEKYLAVKEKNRMILYKNKK